MTLARDFVNYNIRDFENLEGSVGSIGQSSMNAAVVREENEEEKDRTPLRINRGQNVKFQSLDSSPILLLSPFASSSFKHHLSFGDGNFC